MCMHTKMLLHAKHHDPSILFVFPHLAKCNSLKMNAKIHVHTCVLACVHVGRRRQRRAEGE